MLARKSRKNLVENEVVKSDLLKAAGYIRLSVNKADRPSDSIENQKKIIEDYAETNWDIQFVRFYVDDIDLRSMKCWRISEPEKLIV